MKYFVLLSILLFTQLASCDGSTLHSIGLSSSIFRDNRNFSMVGKALDSTIPKFNEIFENCNNSIYESYHYISQVLRNVSTNVYKYIQQDIENRKRQFDDFQNETIFKSLQNLENQFQKPDKFHSSNVRSMAKEIDHLIRISQEYRSIEPIDHWEYLGHEEEIVAWLLKKPLSKDLMSDEAFKWPCIRAKTTINVPPDRLCKILLESKNAVSFNKYCSGKDDAQCFNQNSKIIWSRTKIPFSIKPYDYCIFTHVLKDKDTYLIMSKSVIHDKVPLMKEYTRGEMYYGLNILTPHRGDKNKTDFVAINHVKYPGILPILAKKTAWKGTFTYLKTLTEVVPTLPY